MATRHGQQTKRKVRSITSTKKNKMQLRQFLSAWYSLFHYPNATKAVFLRSKTNNVAYYQLTRELDRLREMAAVCVVPFNWTS
jgi:hypothetical protein